MSGIEECLSRGISISFYSWTPIDLYKSYWVLGYLGGVCVVEFYVDKAVAATDRDGLVAHLDRELKRHLKAYLHQQSSNKEVTTI